MLLCTLLFLVSVAGAVGGVVNALLSNNGFVLPRAEQADGVKILRPGYLGNILIGAVSAGISWGLYGPLANFIILGTPDALSKNPSAGLTLSALVGAVLVGVGGARWLTNEVDKNLLRAAATKAARSHAAPTASRQMAVASPAEALKIAMTMQVNDLT
jgi:hypothetical protein